MGFLIIDIVLPPPPPLHVVGATHWSDYLGWHLQNSTVEYALDEGSAYECAQLVFWNHR